MVLITNNATLPNKRSTRVSGPLQKVSERESVSDTSNPLAKLRSCLAQLQLLILPDYASNSPVK
jgi:hypothetical protein